MVLNNLIIRKNREINILKGMLSARIEEREVIIEKIKYVMEELEELIFIENEFRCKIKNFTMEDLSQYNGKGNNLAYIVIEGTVYDVTGIKEFVNGNCKFPLGKDATEVFYSCLKGDRDILRKARIVGVLKE
ncbi:cytochrome b5 domain-containing protein [Clostridium thermobutyricum]|uniref:Cytochrome b5-like heme/steroid binding domain protein n=1 Tax=Clostridium thermobutyricum DSM 4928 TaxID=1121339 RepID=A0A1V4STF4_9CLOT|nr:cytochrome b5 domain-containing protein [Clostridium thermobutyricum]OPX47083.1 cytochrome b5-like heme/steroid binding domain protein [Clostridium thermobutyricum DSM 4928]